MNQILECSNFEPSPRLEALIKRVRLGLWVSWATVTCCAIMAGIIAGATIYVRFGPGHSFLYCGVIALFVYRAYELSTWRLKKVVRSELPLNKFVPRLITLPDLLDEVQGLDKSEQLLWRGIWHIYRVQTVSWAIFTFLNGALMSLSLEYFPLYSAVAVFVLLSLLLNFIIRPRLDKGIKRIRRLRQRQ